MASIKGLMHKHVVAVSRSTSLGSAVKLMKKSRINVVPVLDGNELAGVLTLEEAEHGPAEKRVGELSLRMVFIELNDKPAHAAQLMVSRNIVRLPVVNGGGDMRCVGVVTSTEIARSHKRNRI